MAGFKHDGRYAARALFGALLVAVSLLMVACSKTEPGPAYAPTLGMPASGAPLPEYKIGIVPMENFRNIYEVFLPIVDYINARLPDARLTLEVPRGLPEFEQGLATNSYAFTLANPYHTCLLYTSPSPRDRQKSRMPSSA